MKRVLDEPVELDNLEVEVGSGRYKTTTEPSPETKGMFEAIKYTINSLVKPKKIQIQCGGRMEFFNSSQTKGWLIYEDSIIQYKELKMVKCDLITIDGSKMAEVLIDTRKNLIIGIDIKKETSQSPISMPKGVSYVS